MDRLAEAGGDRVGVYDLEAETGRAIYVHAKVCVVDDVWAMIGSDNFNRRSWTHDSELSCAILDLDRDHRDPADPAGHGEGARTYARNLRLKLWHEHLGPGLTDEELLDPLQGFDAWRRRAAALDDWHRTGRRGARPPGRVREHRPDPVSGMTALWARPVHRAMMDPDGRPLRLRRRRAI